MTIRQRVNLAAYWLFLGALAVELGACSKPPESPATVANIDFWTCAMRPEGHANKTGKGPSCGLVLIPVGTRKAQTPPKEFGTAEFTVPIQRQQQMGVACSEARIRPVRFNLRSLGILEADKGQEFEC